MPEYSYNTPGLLCPLCEKPQAGDAEESKYQKSIDIDGLNEVSAEVKAYEAQFCWSALFTGTQCTGLSLEERLIEVLKQRDLLKDAVLAHPEYDSEGFCLWCFRTERTGHAKHCLRQKALGIKSKE